MTTKGQTHQHNFVTVELFRILNVQAHYKGTTGDRAILYRKCSCGKGKAFEYGSYKAMLELQQRLLSVDNQVEGGENAPDLTKLKETK